MDFIQEVQVKSSGFEAEYGGALGGVVNVIQKRGSNEWHGSIFTYYQRDRFNAAPNPTLYAESAIRRPTLTAPRPRSAAGVLLPDEGPSAGRRPRLHRSAAT